MVLVPAVLMVSTIRFRSFKTIDLQIRRPYSVLLLIAGAIMLVATHPRFVLVALAWTPDTNSASSQTLTWTGSGAGAMTQIQQIANSNGNDQRYHLYRQALTGTSSAARPSRYSSSVASLWIAVNSRSYAIWISAIPGAS